MSSLRFYLLVVLIVYCFADIQFQSQPQLCQGGLSSGYSDTQISSVPIVKQPILVKQIWYATNPDQQSSLIYSLLKPGSTIGTLKNNFIQDKISPQTCNNKETYTIQSNQKRRGSNLQRKTSEQIPYQRSALFEQELKRLIQSSQNNVIGKLKNDATQENKFINSIYSKGVDTTDNIMKLIPTQQILAKYAPPNSFKFTAPVLEDPPFSLENRITNIKKLNNAAIKPDKDSNNYQNQRSYGSSLTRQDDQYDDNWQANRFVANEIKKEFLTGVSSKNNINQYLKKMQEKIYQRQKNEMMNRFGRSFPFNSDSQIYNQKSEDDEQDRFAPIYGSKC